MSGCFPICPVMQSKKATAAYLVLTPLSPAFICLLWSTVETSNKGERSLKDLHIIVIFDYFNEEKKAKH